MPIICIVDCCRTDVGDSDATRSDPVKSKKRLNNVFIMYSTANTHTADEGKEHRNGAFTECLLKYMDTEMTIDEISKAIVKDLRKELNGEQVLCNV